MSVPPSSPDPHQPPRRPSWWRRLGPGKQFLIVAALGAVAIVFLLNFPGWGGGSGASNTPTTTTDNGPDEQGYLADLGSAGIRVLDPQAMLSQGYTVCGYLRNGGETPGTQASSIYAQNYPNLSQAQASAVVEQALRNLCPGAYHPTIPAAPSSGR